jgi:hypothetical protein
MFKAMLERGRRQEMAHCVQNQSRAGDWRGSSDGLPKEYSVLVDKHGDTIGMTGNCEVLKLVRAPDSEESIEFATSERRYSVVFNANLIFDCPSLSIQARIVNISAGGLMAVALEASEMVGKVSVMIRHCDVLIGKIVWMDRRNVGIKFDDPIHPLNLIASRAAGAINQAKLTAVCNLQSRHIFVPQPEFCGLIESI